MTDDLMERIEGCIANAEHDDEHETLIDARDRIEALAAEIEKLREECQAQYHRGYYDGRTEHWNKALEK